MRPAALVRPTLTVSAVVAGLLWGLARAAESYLEHYVKVRTRVLP